MSSSGTTLEITPLLPWRPAILSPGCSLRFTAMKTLTIFITPGGRSSPRRTFSTLSSKRRSSAFFCSSNWPCSASCAWASASSPRASCHHWPRESVPSSSSSMTEPALMPFGPFTAVLPRIRSLQARVDVALEDRELVVAVAAQPLDLLALDLQRALVLVDAVPVEDPHLDDRAVVARRQPQRGVAHVGRLLAEDGAEELLLRRHRALALGGDLADQDVGRADLGADVDDAGLVEVAQRLLADVRDVAGDLLRPELGVAGGDLELLDVDRGEDVVLGDRARR